MDSQYIDRLCVCFLGDVYTGNGQGHRGSNGRWCGWIENLPVGFRYPCRPEAGFCFYGHSFGFIAAAGGVFWIPLALFDFSHGAGGSISGLAVDGAVQVRRGLSSLPALSQVDDARRDVVTAGGSAHVRNFRMLFSEFAKSWPGKPENQWEQHEEAMPFPDPYVSGASRRCVRNPL